MLWFCTALALVVATAGLACATLGLDGVAFLVGAYVIGWSEVVLLPEALSPFGAIGFTGYAIGEAALFTAAFATWRWRGAPRPSLPRLRVATFRGHTVLAVLGAVVLAGIAYEAFIVLATPPNNVDALTYHLPRAVEWLNRGRLDYFPANTARENAFPLDAELGVLYTFVFTHRDTLAALPQFLAELAILVTIYGSARRLGFRSASAAFAALLTATLSEISLQAVTAQNDLVVASFVLAAAFFLLGKERRELPLVALALGLAVGTKLTALFALPTLAILAIVVLSRRRLLELAVYAVLGFTLVGAWSYADNLIQTGRPLGVVPEETAFTPKITTIGTISTVARVYDRLVDFSGLPILSGVSNGVEKMSAWSFGVAGIPANPPESTVRSSFTFSPNTGANEDFSYFGLLGTLIIVPLSVAFAAAGLLRRAPRPQLVLALALPLFITTLAFANSFNSWLGRFMIIPVVLTMPLAAWVYQKHLSLLVGTLSVVGVVALASTQARSLYKPTGLAGSAPAIWSMSRIDAETLLEPSLARVAEAIDRSVPARGTIGTDIPSGEITYPLYGPTLERKLIPLPADKPLLTAEREHLRWVLLTSRIPGRPSSTWVMSPIADGWVIAARVEHQDLPLPVERSEAGPERNPDVSGRPGRGVKRTPGVSSGSSASADAPASNATPAATSNVAAGDTLSN
jgi:4-amino-4-deoxy-L-arabinose transferase-like glycosyltransferase